MKHLILVALMGLSSSMVLADTQVFENDRKDKSQEFSCHFRGGKDGLRCRVWASVEKERRHDDVVATEERDRDESKLKVECNNGFDLFDRHAKSDSDREEIKVIGRDNGDKAVLKIFDRDRDERTLDRDDRGDDEMRALLFIENGDEDAKLRGRCEKEDDRHDDLI